MLANTLNTNEIKDRAGTEVEFSRISQDARTTEFAKISETPYLPVRMKVQHREVGAGLKRVRQSNIRFDKTTLSGVDNATPMTTSVSFTLTYPVGASTTSNDAADVIAYAVSFIASLGASTTILYDGTGNGAKALLEGGL